MISPYAPTPLIYAASDGKHRPSSHPIVAERLRRSEPVLPRDEWYVELGRNIARQRIGRRWSQKRLATLLGYASGVSVCHIEQGSQTLDAWMVERIERLFGEQVRP